MRLAQLGGCDAAARSQGTERCCADRHACALRFDHRCLPTTYPHMRRVWTGALSGESLLDKRQPRGPICQQAVNRLPCGPTHTHRRALAALITAGRALPSILLGCAAQAVPTLAVARLRYRTAGFVRGTRVAFVGMASKRSAWSGRACTLGSSAGSSSMPSSIGSCVPCCLRRQRLRGLYTPCQVVSAIERGRWRACECA